MSSVHIFSRESTIGVQQGGILSPKQYGMYMYGLTNELSNGYVGCYINDKCVNQIMYVDHICLMSTTGTAVQNLLDV